MSPTQSTVAERRHFWRASFHAPAQLALQSGIRDAALLDISLKGALVELPSGDLVVAGEQCQLRLPIGEAGQAIVMRATVVHVHDGRWLGLHCDGIDIDSITHLRRLVELNEGDPGLIDRELSALLRD
jgi:hypothetical protein